MSSFLCPWEAPQYLIFSSNVPHLLFYSHFIGLFSAIIFSLLFLRKESRSPASNLFLSVVLFFSIWVILDVFLWATNRPDFELFYWSIQVFFELLLYAAAFYFSYRFLRKRDLSIKQKMLLFIPFIPILILLPTTYLFPGIDTACYVIESPLIIYYSYIFEIFLLLSILYLALKEGRQRKEIASKKEVRYFTLGIIVFLLAFSSGNIIGSLTEDWDLAQYGLFGMPIFLGFLTYTVVRYKAFNIKLVGAQALVVSLALLIGAQFFFIQNTTNEILNGITLILGIVFGVLLVKSVKKEIEAKELIQIQRDQLEKANTRLLELDKQKTEFVSFATHQLRSPLTAIRGNASLILEGDLGPISGPLRDVVQTIATSIKTMINVVEDYLNISRLELGTMKYDMQTMDFKDLVKEVVNEQGQNIKAKGLAWTLSLDDSRIYPIKADPDKFKQVVMNIIDNSIKYTSQGSLAFSLIGVEGGFRFGVSDTGVGIDPAVMPKLFQKFTRAPKAHEANIHGTGLGLYIAKEIVAAHGGKIWAESSGEGKGSQFYVEMPEAK